MHAHTHKHTHANKMTIQQECVHEKVKLYFAINLLKSHFMSEQFAHKHSQMKCYV